MSNKININVSGGENNFGSINQGDLKSIDEKNKSHNSIKIFISYRRLDTSEVSGRIYDKLKIEYGEENVFKDVYSIPLGENFKRYIEKKISKSDVVLALIGEKWAGVDDSKVRLKEPNDFIRLELKTAYQQNIPIFPLFIKNAKYPDKSILPEDLYFISYINGIHIHPDPIFNQDIGILIKEINKLRSK